MSIKTIRIVIPGDIVTEAQDITINRKIIVGPGLRKHNDHIIACKAGALKMKHPNIFWIDSYQKRYVPNRGETVIGVIVQKSGDIYRVDIGASEPASISFLAFEGATKKNRPDINVGDLIYANILIASKDFETELVCVDSLGKKNKLGILNGGFVFNCSINLIRKILNENGPLFKAIKRELQVPMEIVVGLNGKIWINARTPKDVCAISCAILAAEFVEDNDISNMCKKVGRYFTEIK